MAIHAAAIRTPQSTPLGRENDLARGAVNLALGTGGGGRNRGGLRG